MLYEIHLPTHGSYRNKQIIVSRDSVSSLTKRPRTYLSWLYKNLTQYRNLLIHERIRDPCTHLCGNYYQLSQFSCPFDYKITLNSICKIQHYYYYITIDCFHTYIGISFRSEHDKMAKNPRIGFFTTALVYVSFWQSYFSMQEALTSAQYFHEI